jgi:hypothetical protein
MEKTLAAIWLHWQKRLPVWSLRRRLRAESVKKNVFPQMTWTNADTWKLVESGTVQQKARELIV